MIICRLDFFFKKHFFREILSVPNGFHPLADKMSGLTSAQTVCKRYQQTSLVGKELKYFDTSYGLFWQKICLEVDFDQVTVVPTKSDSDVVFCL